MTKSEKEMFQGLRNYVDAVVSQQKEMVEELRKMIRLVEEYGGSFRNECQALAEHAVALSMEEVTRIIVDSQIPPNHPEKGTMKRSWLWKRS